MKTIMFRPYSRIFFRSLSAVICITVPFSLVCYGYGAYLTLPFIFLSVAVVTICFTLALERLLGLPLYELSSSNKIKSRLIRGKIGRIVSLLLLFLVGWFVGSQVREFYCRGICDACNFLVEELNNFSKLNGNYPKKLSMLPGYQNFANTAGIEIYEQYYHPPRIEIANISSADVTFFLRETDYVCVVPVEKNIPMSFTYFSAYVRGPQDQNWRRVDLLTEIGLRRNVPDPGR